MSKESNVRVTIIYGVSQHPNADLLDIGTVDGGYPVITKRGEYRDGDTVVYVPVDTMVPTDGEFAWLGKGAQHRVKAKRLRGVFSMGLVLPALAGDSVGDVVGERYGMSKYEPPAEQGANDGLLDKHPVGIDVPIYDIEGWRKYSAEVFTDPEEIVVVTEKLHGANARFMFWEGRLRVGSRTQWKLLEGESPWSRVAKACGLAEVCESLGEGVVIFGEVLGVQDLRYGVDSANPGFRIFDVLDAKTYRWWNDAEIDTVPVPRVPVLYRGPVKGVDLAWAEGKSTLANHVREGFVITPVQQRFSTALGGRAILKLQGEGYLTR